MVMMLKLCLPGLMLLFAACTTASPTYLANGMAAYRITCNPGFAGLNTCYEAAAELCGRRGFAVYDWSGVPWPLPYPDPASLESISTLGSASLLVACRS
jgi:hypothetical protein